nr:ATP-binding protein [Gemmatimonadaceae bacterium]
MRGLQTRIFLTVWPLFVVAILAVGALSSRSARIELADFEARMPPPSLGDVPAALTDSVVTAWPVLRTTGGAGALQRIASRLGDSSQLLVLTPSGAVVASSEPALARATIRMTPNAAIDLMRTVTVAGAPQVQRLLVSGARLESREHGLLGYLYVLPRTMPPPSGARLMVAGIQRSLWLAVLLACLLAAVGTWMLAYPLVAQVRRLSAAASAVQGKSLSTRVRVSSRDELGELEQSFNRMAESLEQTEAAKRQLLSDLAHELRTPLTNVIGQLEAMRDGLRPPDAGTLLSTQEEALLLKQLIDELQELALADAGGLTFDLRALDARVEVQRAAEAFQASTPVIRLELPDDQVPVLADPRRLAQVLRNGLQNAITHTPRDGQITVSVRAEPDRTILAIADSGRGIPPEHLPLIWDRFYRVDASRDRSTGGMGLGLALTRRMVEGMGGTITASSEVGVGTTMTIRM